MPTYRAVSGMLRAPDTPVCGRRGCGTMSGTTPARRKETVITSKLVARVEKARVLNRWNEKVLHVPADIAVIWVALMSAVSLGVVALLVLAVVAIFAAIVFFS